MNHKRALKKFMGFGYSRNKANSMLRLYKKSNLSNKACVDQEGNFRLCQILASVYLKRQEEDELGIEHFKERR